MPPNSFIFILLVLGFWLFLFGERKANLRHGINLKRSLPVYHGVCFALCGLLPALAFALLWLPLNALALNAFMVNTFEQFGVEYTAFNLEAVYAIGRGDVKPSSEALLGLSESLTQFLARSMW